VTGISKGRQRGKIYPETIHCRPIKNEDREFLYQLYASTRFAEMTVSGWGESQTEIFLRMQLRLQHMHYVRNYPGASFSIVCVSDTPAGRLYIERKKDRIQIIDISLLPEFRKRGAGGCIMRGLAGEADTKGLKISLHVERNNPLLPFCKNLGFREIEQRGVHYYMERNAVNRTCHSEPKKEAKA